MALKFTRELVNEFITKINLRLKQGISLNEEIYSLSSNKLPYIIKLPFTEYNLKSLKEELEFYQSILNNNADISYIHIIINTRVSGSFWVYFSYDNQHIKYSTYVYNDDKIDVRIHFHLFDNNIINEYNMLLLENNIKSLVENNSIYISNLGSEDYMAIKLIESESDVFNKLYIDERISLKFEKTINMKTFLETYPHKIREFIKLKLRYYPEYMELTKNDSKHYANLYELGIEYVKGRSDVEEIYLLLANIVISNPGELTKKEKKLVLKYLLKASKLKEAVALKNRLFWSWAGYSDPPFDIQLNVDSLIKLAELLKEK